MKGYKRFIFAFSFLLALYILLEFNRPKPIDWKITISSEDKAPFGGYIVFHQLKDLFPTAVVNSFRSPVYNQLNNYNNSNTAYILIADQLNLSAEDVNELLNYVISGNYVFLAASNFSRVLMDSLNFKTGRRFDLIRDDSVSINLKNPALHAARNYEFKPATIDGYLNKYDTANDIVLGTNQLEDINFIKRPYGEGAFFIHALPLCFSNYFQLTGINAEYTSKVLSYLPKNISSIFWDEYYKMGASGSQNPLRFVLNNIWLKWSFRLGLVAMLVYILFGIKRKQRSIPVIVPLGNSTVNFVKTIGDAYFHQHNNQNIALKKISYFLEQVRSNLGLPTNELNEEFIQMFARKTATQENEVSELTELIREVQEGKEISDEILLRLNKTIDRFYSTIIG